MKELYKVVKQVIPKELTEFIYQYLLNKRKVVRHYFDTRYIPPFNADMGYWNDATVPNTYSHYADIVMETLLTKLKPRVEQESGLKLYETYSYARIYKNGDILKRHKDRYSCEVSTTLNLGGEEWAIFLEPSGEEGEEGVKVIQEPGDMLMYRGGDMEHWREPFEGENYGQVFLHYNDVLSERPACQARPRG